MSTESVFIVDDEAPLAEMVSMVVNSAGFETRCYTSAMAALEAANASAPVCVFLDLAMPEMTGVDFLREFRRSQQTHDVPVVLMTGSRDHQNFRKVLPFRPNDYLTKPFGPDDIRTALRRVLGRDEEFVDTFFEVISHRLREARKKLGLKQADVAKRCALSTSQVSQIELRQSSPSVTTLLRLCKALNMTMSDLVKDF